MSELTKNQLKQDNTNSFPNNNGGLITPAILRDFNNNMIDSLVDEVTYNIDSASFNSRINDLDPSGSQQSFAALEAATASLQIATASLNAYTASQNLFNSSATASIVALQNFSSSLDATFATDAQLTSLSSSIAVTDSAQSASIAALQLFSSSLDSTYATDAQLSASVSALSASVAVTDLSQSSSIAQLLGFSSSLDATFATDAQLNTLSSSIAVTDLSQSSSIAALQSFSSSLDATFATDAQLTSLSASIAVTDLSQSSSIAQLLGFSSSLDATYATDAQLTALSSSIAVTDSGQDSKINSLTAATSSYITSAQTASMSVLSSSFATTASFALTAGGVDTGSLLLTASFNAYTSSNDGKVNSLISKTGSYATTGSNTFSGTNTFNADVRVRNNQNLYVGFISENGIGGASPGIHIDTDNGLAITSSVWINGITRVTGSVSASAGFSGNLIGTSSFATTASFALNATTIDTSSLVTTSSFNSYTSSNDSKVNALISVTGSYVTESETSSFARTNVSNTFSVGQTLQGVLDIQEAGNPSVYTSISQNAADGKLRFGQVGATGFDFLNDVKVSGSVTASNFIGTASYATQALTASFALNVVSVDTSSLVTTSSFNSYTASASTAVSGAINSATQSLSSSIAVTTNGLDLEVNQKLDSASFNSYTQSNDSKVNSLIAATGSYAISSSVATITGLSLVTASISGDTITFTKGNGSTFPIVVPVASGSVPAGTVSSSAQISEFGYATTSSVSQSVSSLNAATSSYITSAQTSSMTVLSASFAQTAQTAQSSTTASYVESASFAVNAGLLDGKDSTEFATTASNVFVGNQTISASLYVRGGDINHISNNTTLNPDLYLTESLAGQVNIIKGWSDTVAAAGPGLVQSNYTGSIRITGSNNTISLPQIAATGLGGTSDQFGYISGSDNQILSNNAAILLNTGSLLTPKTQNNILTNGSSIRMNFLNSGSLTAGNPLVISNLLLGGVISVNSNSGSLQSISTNILNGGSIASVQSFATNTKPTISSNILNGGTVTLNHISSSITYQNNNVNATLNINNHLSSSGLSTNGLSVTNNMIFGGSSSSPINIYVSGSQNSNTSRVITDSIIGGRNINISSSFFSSSNASLVSSVIVGNGLTVSASHAASTNGGTAFFGRFNDTGSLSLAQDIIFAVGTGTSLTSRRTGLWIDTGSNTNISGTLEVIGNTAFTGSVDVSGSTTTLQNLGGIALAVRSGSVEVTSPQGTGYFYSNLPITSSGLRINGTGLVSDLIVSGVFSGNSSLQVFGSSSFTGSVFTSASVNGVVNPLTISSQTASLDFSKGNFFTVQLVSGSSTHINPTNVVAGQTISVRLNTTGSGTVTFASSIKQASGSSYVPTTTTGVDVITMVTFDTSDIYISNLKNFS